MIQKTDLHDELVDDYADFQRLLKGLSSIGFSDQDVNTVFGVVAAVLHLGNVHFIENIEDSKGKDNLFIIAKLESCPKLALGLSFCIVTIIMS